MFTATCVSDIAMCITILQVFLWFENKDSFAVASYVLKEKIFFYIIETNHFLLF